MVQTDKIEAIGTFCNLYQIRLALVGLWLLLRKTIFCIRHKGLYVILIFNESEMT